MDPKLGHKDPKASAAFFAALQAAVDNPAARVILVHRCNVMVREVDAVFKAVRDGKSARGVSAKFLIVRPEDMHTQECLAACMLGVLKPIKPCE